MNRAHNVACLVLPALAALMSSPAFAHVGPAHGVLGLFGVLPHAHESDVNFVMAMLPYGASFLLTAYLLIGKNYFARKKLPGSL